MFNELQLNSEFTRLRQQERLDSASKSHQKYTSGNGSPVLAAIGKQLVNIGERLQQAARMQERADIKLQTKQA